MKQKLVNFIINMAKIILKNKLSKDHFQLELYESLFNKTILSKKPFYNIGAGSFRHPHWTNIDYDNNWYNEVQEDFLHFDLMQKQPLPIENSTALLIYTSHTIEHITDDSVLNLFHEANRVLTKGGIFRITCPDAEADFRAMLTNDILWYYWDEVYVNPGSYEHIFHNPATSVPIEERWLHHFASQLAPNDKTLSRIKYNSKEIKKIVDELGFEGALDYFTTKCEFNPERPGNHISWWSSNKIMSFLQEAGFKTTYRSGYGQSASPILRNTFLFDSTHPKMSVYVEAIKT